MKHPIFTSALALLLAPVAFAAEAPRSSPATAPTTAAGTAPAAPAHVKAGEPGTQPGKKKKLMEKAEEAFADFGDKVAGVLKADPKDSAKPAPGRADHKSSCAADSKAADCAEK